MAIFSIVWTWILAHREGLGGFCIGVALMLFLDRLGSKTTPIQASTTATQAQSGKAETKVVYRYIKGQECPEIEVSSVLTGSQGQTATAQAQYSPPKPSLAIPLGIGYLDHPFVSAGLRYEHLETEALYCPPLGDLPAKWGGKATWSF